MWVTILVIYDGSRSLRLSISCIYSCASGTQTLTDSKEQCLYGVSKMPRKDSRQLQKLEGQLAGSLGHLGAAEMRKKITSQTEK